MAASMGPLYIVTERFDSHRGSGWQRYVAWSGLTQLTEVVSLDAMLCPYVVDDIRDTDWPHIVNEDFMLSFFRDLDYLRQRVGDTRGKNLLCVFRNPPVPPSVPMGRKNFAFEGYDLVDVHGGVSALTNCGGFPKAFGNTELSPHGLLPSLDRAYEVQRSLQVHYSGQGHAQCHVWAIFRADAA